LIQLTARSCNTLIRSISVRLIALAKQMVDGQAIELWHEARMIAAFEPEK
jgi:hypothetical protein